MDAKPITRGMAFMSSRINVTAECLDRLESVCSFFTPHFVISTAVHSNPCATLFITESDGGEIPTTESSEEVWVRRSSSEAFSIPASRVITPGGEQLVCTKTGTLISFEHESRTIRIQCTPQTRPIELIEVIRDLVLKTQQMRGTAILHSAVVCRGNRAALIIGEKGAGKTTTALELVERLGCDLHSGDKALLQSDGDTIRVYGWPDWPNLGIGTIRKYHRLASRLGIEKRLSEATPEELWSTSNKVAVDPDLYKQCFRLSERSGPMEIAFVLYPAIGPSNAFNICSATNHYPLMASHLETAFHTDSHWNSFVKHEGTAAEEEWVAARQTWNQIPGYRMTGDGKLPSDLELPW